MRDNSDSLAYEDVEYGVDGEYFGIYDGVIAWKMKDGTLINRFEGVPGRERIADRTQELIDAGEIE
jgi:hypothetical protein